MRLTVHLDSHTKYDWESNSTYSLITIDPESGGTIELFFRNSDEVTRMMSTLAELQEKFLTR